MKFLDRLFAGAGKEKGRYPYDPLREYPVIRSSICTGEKVAGFKNREDGHFTDVMFIRNKADEEKFKKLYDIDDLPVEY
ncbi:hypothetical protein SAMN06296952_1248 [Oscillospiraceae bacterium]|nr:hypothetical protein SAMN06296952_1248 [Oscillospiraceae bacterium]